MSSAALPLTTRFRPRDRKILVLVDYANGGRAYIESSATSPSWVVSAFQLQFANAKLRANTRRRGRRNRASIEARATAQISKRRRAWSGVEARSRLRAPQSPQAS